MVRRNLKIYQTIPDKLGYGLVYVVVQYCSARALRI